MGNFADPLMYLIVLGYGLGRFVGEVEGMTYMAFLASGVICTSAVNSASFEGMYSAYTRMEVQREHRAFRCTSRKNQARPPRLNRRQSVSCTFEEPL